MEALFDVIGLMKVLKSEARPDEIIVISLELGVPFLELLDGFTIEIFVFVGSCLDVFTLLV